MTIKDESTIQRALGIIEGVLLTADLPAKITQTLYAELTTIDEVLRGEKHEP